MSDIEIDTTDNDVLLTPTAANHHPNINHTNNERNGCRRGNNGDNNGQGNGQPPTQQI
jgi:hypothetical protein